MDTAKPIKVGEGWTPEYRKLYEDFLRNLETITVPDHIIVDECCTGCDHSFHEAWPRNPACRFCWFKDKVRTEDGEYI